MKIGDGVVYVDEFGQDRAALLTAVHGSESDPAATVNVVYVSNDPNRTDGYGRQTEHASSVQHESLAKAHGRYWRAVS